MKKKSLFFYSLLISFLITSCENAQYKQEKKCREILKSPHPKDLKDKTNDIEKSKEYDECLFTFAHYPLQSEIKRFPEYDLKINSIEKISGRFYLIRRENSAGFDSIEVKHKWLNSYPKGEARYQYDDIKAGDTSFIEIKIYSKNVGGYRHLSDGRLVIPKFDKDICIETKDKNQGRFYWNDAIFIIPWYKTSFNQVEKEWKTLCPEIYDVVSNFKEVKLKPFKIKKKNPEKSPEKFGIYLGPKPKSETPKPRFP